MNEQERYAEVKRLFLAAVELPTTNRTAFLDEQCGVVIRREVETLLAHHNSETIIAEDHARTSIAEQPDSLLDRGIVTDSIDKNLCPQLAAELIHLLRRRLKGLAAVLTVALLVSLIRSIINPQWDVHWPEIFVLSAVVGSWILLHSSDTLPFLSLRIIEGVIMSTVCVLIFTFDFYQIMNGAGNENPATILGAIDRSQLSWCMMIMIYGIFVPNTWRRAALFLIPLACLPYLIRFVVSSSNSFVNDTLQGMSYVRPLPMPFLAAFSAIFAAHLFDVGRAKISHARSFAQYRIRRLLGRGGMGEVYEAEHSLLKRRCAIKVVRPDRQYNPSTLSRFEKEVQSTARLTHPNTIEVYDYGQTIDGIFYYVMEFLRGVSLEGLVTRFGPLPPGRASYILQQVCGALQEAHDAGLIHRDIKPGNLFVCEQGGEQDVVKVLDFGLVATVANDEATSHIDQTRLMGTPPFMPPEQGLGSGEVDARTDIYALGATAYYLVTGSQVFDEPTPQTQLLAHLTMPVPPPSQRADGLPGDFENVILRCLEKDPADRYQSMRELQLAFEQCGCSKDWTHIEAEGWWQSHAQ